MDVRQGKRKRAMWPLALIAGLSIVLILLVCRQNECPVPQPLGETVPGKTVKWPEAAEAPTAPSDATPAKSPAPAQVNLTTAKPEVSMADLAESAPKTPVTAAIISQQAQAFVATLKSTNMPLEARQGEIAKLAKSKDAQAFELLAAAGNERIYLNWAAVEAMGAFHGTPSELAARQYLQAKLGDEDSQIACAAIRGYATLTGAEAIAALAQALQNNRERPDGHQEIVCTAAVKALQETGSPAAVPALIAELARSEVKGWSMEYGSSVLAALRPTSTPEGRAGAAAYAQRLSARIPEDKLAKAYFEEKIAEAQKVAGK